MPAINIIILIFSIGLLVTTVELVRRKHLREKYSLIWLLTSVALIAISLSRGLIDQISLKLNVYYPPSLLFLAGIFFLLVLVLMLSVIVSHQTSRIISLVQQLGILEKRVRDIESDKPSKK